MELCECVRMVVCVCACCVVVELCVRDCCVLRAESWVCGQPASHSVNSGNLWVWFYGAASVIENMFVP